MSDDSNFTLLVMKSNAELGYLDEDLTMSEPQAYLGREEVGWWALQREGTASTKVLRQVGVCLFRQQQRGQSNRTRSGYVETVGHFKTLYFTLSKIGNHWKLISQRVTSDFILQRQGGSTLFGSILK